MDRTELGEVQSIQPTETSPLDLWVTAGGVRENHNWYMDTTHMKAKHRPITAPAAITTQANG
jgi:hypothetical protein